MTMLDSRRILTVVLLCMASTSLAQESARPCGSPPHDSVCLGELDVPERYRADFNQAARLAVDGIYSEQFERELAAFIRDHTGSGAHAERWMGLTAESVIERLRQGINGQRITTYGGLIAKLNYRANGNLAYDGAESGPIRVNREALPRAAAEIANTIVHEVAHRTGLKHRKKGRSAPARCEPPYVIGTLVEKWALGARWRRRADDCQLLPEA
jgi:hypothetical protein